MNTYISFAVFNILQYIYYKLLTNYKHHFVYQFINNNKKKINISQNTYLLSNKRKLNYLNC